MKTTQNTSRRSRSKDSSDLPLGSLPSLEEQLLARNASNSANFIEKHRTGRIVCFSICILFLCAFGIGGCLALGFYMHTFLASPSHNNEALNNTSTRVAVSQMKQSLQAAKTSSTLSSATHNEILDNLSSLKPKSIANTQSTTTNYKSDAILVNEKHVSTSSGNIETTEGLTKNIQETQQLAINNTTSINPSSNNQTIENKKPEVIESHQNSSTIKPQNGSDSLLEKTNKNNTSLAQLFDSIPVSTVNIAEDDSKNPALLSAEPSSNPIHNESTISTIHQTDLKASTSSTETLPSLASDNKAPSNLTQITHKESSDNTDTELAQVSEKVLPTSSTLESDLLSAIEPIVLTAEAPINSSVHAENAASVTKSDPEHSQALQASEIQAPEIASVQTQTPANLQKNSELVSEKSQISEKVEASTDKNENISSPQTASAENITSLARVDSTQAQPSQSSAEPVLQPQTTVNVQKVSELTANTHRDYEDIIADLNFDLQRDAIETPEENFIESQTNKEFSDRPDALFQKFNEKNYLANNTEGIGDVKIQSWLHKQHIQGVAYKGMNSCFIVNQKVFHLGDIINPELALTWTDIDPKERRLYFIDAKGVSYTSHY